MNKRIGISIYPDKTKLQDTIEYIKLANKHGVKRVFSNLLEIDNSIEGKKRLETLKQTLILANELGMEVIVDVAPSVYDSLNLNSDEFQFFKKIGATGIRMDNDFKGLVESKLSQNITVELNASLGTKTMELTLSNGGNHKNLIACHNFYPMEYTGLDYRRFLELSSWYKEKNIRVAAFVSLPREQKDTIGPWNVNDGIPTLEEHRNATLSQQIRHFLSTNVVDDIIFSEQGVKKAQFDLINDLVNNQSFKINQEQYSKIGIGQEEINKLKIHEGIEPTLIFEIEDLQKISEIESTIIFDYPHFNREDINSYFIRSTFSRITFSKSEIKHNKTEKEFLEVGDVVILNENYNRYKGELHIITKRIPNSNKRNYVGRIPEFDHKLLEFAKPGRAFKIIKKGE